MSRIAVLWNSLPKGVVADRRLKTLGSVAWDQYAAHNRHVQDFSEISFYTEKWLFKNDITIPKKS